MVKAAGSGDTGAKIVKLKDDQGKTWSEISDAVGLPVGKAMFEYEKATVTPKTKITAKDEETLKRKIAQGREEGLSWGRLAARSGKSEGFCKAAFEEVTGNTSRGNRIGKGGRYPGDEVSTNGSAPKKVKGAAAKKASGAVKKAAGKAPASKKAVAKKAAKKTPIKKKAVASTSSEAE